MNIKISGNMTVTNGQMGDVNTMTAKCHDNMNLLQEEDWREIKDFLSKRLTELPKSGDSIQLVKEGLNYVERKDESGFRGFYLRNRESFINNVCSNIVSSGLMLILSKLNF